MSRDELPDERRAGRLEPDGPPDERRLGPNPLAEEVLALVEQVPPGSVTTYGDLAELVGRGGPRGVGQVMALWGGGVTWWRVVHADGRPADCHDGEALELLRAEGVALRGSERVDLRLARWAGPAGE